MRDIGQHESQIFADRSKEEASFAKRKSRYSDYTGPSLKEVEAAAAVEEAEAQQSYEVAMAECRARGNKSTKGEDFTGELKVAGSAWSGAGDEFKPRYYFEKFGITDADEVVHTCVRQSFLEALVERKERLGVQHAAVVAQHQVIATNTQYTIIRAKHVFKT